MTFGSPLSDISMADRVLFLPPLVHNRSSPSSFGFMLSSCFHFPVRFFGLQPFANLGDREQDEGTWLGKRVGWVSGSGSAPYFLPTNAVGLGSRQRETTEWWVLHGLGQRAWIMNALWELGVFASLGEHQRLILHLYE